MKYHSIHKPWQETAKVKSISDLKSAPQSRTLLLSGPSVSFLNTSACKSLSPFWHIKFPSKLRDWALPHQILFLGRIPSHEVHLALSIILGCPVVYTHMHRYKWQNQSPCYKEKQFSLCYNPAEPPLNKWGKKPLCIILLSSVRLAVFLSFFFLLCLDYSPVLLLHTNQESLWH